MLASVAVVILLSIAGGGAYFTFIRSSEPEVTFVPASIAAGQSLTIGGRNLYSSVSGAHLDSIVGGISFELPMMPGTDEAMTFGVPEHVTPGEYILTLEKGSRADVFAMATLVVTGAIPE